MTDEEDAGKLDQVLDPNLEKDEQILVQPQLQRKIDLVSHGPKNIEEMIEDYINHQNISNDLANPAEAHKVDKNNPNDNASIKSVVSIPNTDNISSSPEITFGQATLSMIEEFMENENHPEKLEPSKNRGFFSKIFRCC